MQKINFQNLPSTSTPINATNLNALQTNVENAINLVSTYSTTETIIGTWIDGKPLYRQVYTISDPQSSNTNYIDLSSLNIATVVNLKGFYSTIYGTFSIPMYDSDTNYSVMFVNDTNQLRGRIVTQNSINDTKIIIEYTKSTD